MPLRFLRLAKAVTVVSLASAPFAALSMPAFAATASVASSVPHARPATRGAVPRRHPVPPYVPGSGAVIMHEITGDAEFSGLLLLMLLVPITMYGLALRRRDRREVADLPAERVMPGQARSGHGSMLADPLLEFFGPQHARPAAPAQGSRTPHAPRFQPRAGLTGRSTISAPLAARPAFEAPPSSAAGPPGDQGHAGGAGSAPFGQRTSITPLNGAGRGVAAGQGAASGQDLIAAGPPAGGAGPTVRQAHVSGAPPWEPAKRPTSDLPWTVVPPQQAPSRPVSQELPAIPPPPDSVWDSAPPPKAPRPRPSVPPPSLFASPEPGQDRSSGPAAPTGPGSSPRSASTAAPVPADVGPQPTSWQDLPGSEPTRQARRRRPAERKADGERGPIFVWSPMGSGDNKR